MIGAQKRDSVQSRTFSSQLKRMIIRQGRQATYLKSNWPLLCRICDLALSRGQHEQLQGGQVVAYLKSAVHWLYS